jgi:hypothetical protein
MRYALLVRGIESVANLRGILKSLIHRQWAFKWRALDVFHYQIIGTNIVELADVWMIQRTDGLGFSFESFGELFLRNLDRDIATDAGITRLPCLSHAAFPNKRDAFIWAEFVAWRERHIQDSVKFS